VCLCFVLCCVCLLCFVFSVALFLHDDMVLNCLGVAHDVASYFRLMCVLDMCVRLVRSRLMCVLDLSDRDLS
jgi:hypothetical protein